MKKLLGICLGLVILLAGCGKSEVDGTYSNQFLSVTAHSNDSNEATLHIYDLESEGFLGMGAHDGNFRGTIDAKEKMMKFDLEGEKVEFKYEVKDNKLILTEYYEGMEDDEDEDDDEEYGDEKIVLTKEN